MIKTLKSTMSTNFPLLIDLPVQDQNELIRINNLAVTARSVSEAAYLASRLQYLTNEIIERDSSNLIVQSAGNTLPTGLTGFKKGALFILKNATGVASYQNTSDETSAVWELVDDNNFTAFAPVNGVAATVTLTSDNTNVANNATVTIGSIVYTFKTSLTASTTAYEVLIGSDADDSLLNLKKAINGEAGGGTKYGSLTPTNTQVSCGVVTAHAVLLTALIAGTSANSIASTETSTHLAFDTATLVGGVDGTVGYAGQQMTTTSYLYVCVAVNTAAGANWRRVSLGSAY